MFSLIITIVSIALVVALVAATMYHGGDTLTQGRTSADASAFVSGAQQIAAAATMYNTIEGAMPADVAALVTDSYLTSQPSVKGTGSWALDTANRQVTMTLTNAPVCEQINKNAGEADGVLANLTGVSYGCVNDGATKTGDVYGADVTFGFKF